MKISPEGLALIKQFEGCRLTAYQDIVGRWTIGYGSTDPTYAFEGNTITQDQASLLLEYDLSRFEVGVDRLVTGSVTEPQFSALVCFSYNVGLGNLGSSTLLKLVNAGRINEAADQFVRWARAGGQIVQGLLRRREAERDLFLS